MRTLLALSLLAALCFAPSTTLAAPTSAAEALVARGLDLRRQKRDAESVPLFRRAFQIEPTPKREAQLGLAELGAGDFVAAETHLEHALAATSDAWIAKHRTSLEDSLSRAKGRLATLRVEGAPSGGEVLINDSHVGNLPLARPLRVPAGTVVLEIRKDGYVSMRRILELAPRSAGFERVALVRLQPSRSDPTGHHGGVDPAHVGDQPATSKMSTRRILAWTFLAGAVAGVAGGSAAFALRQRRITATNECIADAGRPLGECRSLADSARTAQAGGIASFVTAGVLAGASAALFIWSRPASKPISRARPVRLGAGPGVVGLTAAADF